MISNEYFWGMLLLTSIIYWYLLNAYSKKNCSKLKRRLTIFFLPSILILVWYKTNNVITNNSSHSSSYSSSHSTSILSDIYPISSSDK